MQEGFNQSRKLPSFPSAAPTIRIACACSSLLLLVASACAVRAQAALANQAEPKQSIHDDSITRPPDANAQMQMREQATQRANFDAANAERKRQLSEDSEALLKLATDLKQELAKTPKDTLSLSVVHKAEEIERLAHSVQVKMKLTVNVKN